MRKPVRKKPETKIRSAANDNLFDTNRHAPEPDTKKDNSKAFTFPRSPIFFISLKINHRMLICSHYVGLYRLCFGHGNVREN